MDLADGEMVEMKGSAAKPYQLRNTGGLYSCSCPAWRNQSIAIERRTCKHLQKLRGAPAESERVGADVPVRDERDAIEAAAKAPPLLLAHTWTTEEDLTGWWMSEKLDGVRAWWDGAQFLSRLGNRYHAPPWFVAGLPDTPLDGELWVGRKAFQRTVGIVRRQDQGEQWRDVRFVVFDAPALDLPFEARVDAVRDTLAGGRAPYASAHTHEPCRGTTHLLAELDRLCALGAEGVMVRQPGSRYETGRSTTLYKVKRFHDAEARVLEHQGGAGRHKGRLGALVVELQDGKRFSIGTGFSDAEREAPPAVGSTVTFRYQELSDGGVPRFPSFVGVRLDAVVAAGVTTVASPPPAPVAGWRRFELVHGASAKFWAVTTDGATQTVRYGRIGTSGQEKSKALADAAACARDTDKLVSEKVAKGYAEVGS
jgi:DNA ligase-1